MPNSSERNRAAQGEEPGAPSMYTGSALMFEGGVRGGGDFETLPSTQPYPKKKGYDEHQQVGTDRSGAGTSGIPGVEGMPASVDGKGLNGMDDGDGDSEESDGMVGCPHGCGMRMKTPHGLARHVKAAHGGFGGLGAAIKGIKAGASEQGTDNDVANAPTGKAGCAGKGSCGTGNLPKDDR